MHIVPLQVGFWLPSLASANSGFVTQSAVCSCFVLGKHLPKVWLIVKLSASSRCYRSAFLHALHKPQASSFLHNSHMCWVFVRVFFFYLLWQAVSIPFLLLTNYTFPVFQRISRDTPPHPLKGIGQETQEQIQENTHQWSIRSFKSLNNYPESFLDNLFDVWLNDSMQSYCWSATIINQTDTTT